MVKSGAGGLRQLQKKKCTTVHSWYLVPVSTVGPTSTVDYRYSSTAARSRTHKGTQATGQHIISFHLLVSLLNYRCSTFVCHHAILQPACHLVTSPPVVSSFPFFFHPASLIVVSLSHTISLSRTSLPHTMPLSHTSLLHTVSSSHTVSSQCVVSHLFLSSHHTLPPLSLLSPFIPTVLLVGFCFVCRII